MKHTYQKGLIGQSGCFFIGLAPLLGGAITIGAITYCLMPDLYKVTNQTESALLGFRFDLISTYFQNTSNHYISQLKNGTTIDGVFFLWVYLCASIALYMSPSREDFKNSKHGFIALTGILFLTSLVIENVGTKGIVLLSSPIMLISNIFILATLLALIATTATIATGSIVKIISISIYKLTNRVHVQSR